MLIPLEPLGVGTAGCESLSSYVQRLAVAHGCLPGQLVFRLLTWLDLGKQEMIGQWQRRPGRVRIGKNNNSFLHAVIWLQLLQRVTNRCDLTYLTTRAWDHLFPTRGFQRASLAWCPLCLAEDKEPYHRLSWMFQSSRLCPRHRIPLKTRCVRCGRLPPIVHERSAVTMCPWCAGDLRLADCSSKIYSGEFDYWAAQEVGQIVAQSVDWHRPLSWNPAEALSRLARTERISDAAALGRYIGTSKITAWYWLAGKARPSLPMALHVYHRFGASLAAELSGQPPVFKPALVSQPEFHLRQRKAKQHRNWNDIGRHLLAELSKPPMEDTSVTSIGAWLDIDPRTLRRHFPKLCIKLARRRRKLIRANAERRLRSVKIEIAGAAGQLSQQGAPVDQHSVAGLLNRPGLFCRPSARNAFRQLLDAGFSEWTSASEAKHNANH